MKIWFGRQGKEEVTNGEKTFVLDEDRFALEAVGSWLLANN